MQKEKLLNKKIIFLSLLAIACLICYLMIDIKFNSTKALLFIMKIRSTKLISITIAAICIGSASLIFQSIINNHIVTPCLLGMNSFYTLIHTTIIFMFGTSSLFATNTNITFVVDVILMSILSTTIYSYIFKKTKYNILYILLIGTVLTSLFTSIQNTMIRMMDPSDYDVLLNKIVANFNNINKEIIILSLILVVCLVFIFKNELSLLNVITLGKDQSINLGVDYNQTIRKLLFAVTILIAIATALVGPISFIGLLLANISRNFLKTYRHFYLIIASSLFGIIGLITSQLFVEHIFNYTIPITVFINIIGGIYFLLLLIKSRKGVN